MTTVRGAPGEVRRADALSPASRHADISLARRPAPLLSFVLLLAAVQMASCNSLLESDGLPFALSSLPTISRRLTSEPHDAKSGRGRNVIATAVPGFARASLTSSEEVVRPLLQMGSPRGSVAFAAPAGPSTARLSRRRLTQATEPPYVNVSQIVKLLASDDAAGNYFGWSLAVDGDTMVIGAYGDSHKGANSGAAYIFSRDVAESPTASWTQRAKLLASDGAEGDSFGVSVAVSGDTVAVGAQHDNDKGSNSGSAYVFTRDDAGNLTASWTQRAKLLATDGAANDFFGRSIAVSRDTVVVGAHGDDDEGSFSGSAYVFTRDAAGILSASWTQRAKLLATDGAAGDLFGWSMAISGETIVVGAYGDDDAGSGSGSAYIFTPDVAGSLTAGWTQHAKLLASDGATGDQFGVSVAISGDTVVVGAYGDADNGAASGSAYIFTRSGAGNPAAGWTQSAKLLPSDGAAYDEFARSVAISGDTVVIGSYYDDDKGSWSGSAYVFMRDVAGRLTASWTQRAKLLASDGAAGDFFGYSVGISGHTVAVGARFDDEDGSAYVFASLPFPVLPPAFVSVGATYTLAGYTEVTFGTVERTGFVAAIAKLLMLSPAAVRVIGVANKYASGRRHLTQMVAVDIDFVVDVLDLTVATSVGTQLDGFGSNSSGVLITELKLAGLSDVTDVTLSKGAATFTPPSPSESPPSESETNHSFFAALGTAMGVSFLLMTWVSCARFSFCPDPFHTWAEESYDWCVSFTRASWSRCVHFDRGGWKLFDKEHWKLGRMNIEQNKYKPKTFREAVRSVIEMTSDPGRSSSPGRSPAPRESYSHVAPASRTDVDENCELGKMNIESTSASDQSSGSGRTSSPGKRALRESYSRVDAR